MYIIIVITIFITQKKQMCQENLFKEIQEAHSTLSDGWKRALYDQDPYYYYYYYCYYYYYY